MAGLFHAASHVLLDWVMAQINSFRDLLVWQKAMDLAVRCYGVSRRMPRDEQRVLGYQIRKCAVSMPSNIAEGKARQSTAIYTNHLWVAHGSGAELETQLELGARVKVVSEAEAEAPSRTHRRSGECFRDWSDRSSVLYLAPDTSFLLPGPPLKPDT